MKKYLSGIISFAVLSVTLLASAAPGRTEERKQTLRQVIDYALLHNGELQSFREEKGGREADRIKAGLLPNPVLEFDGSSGALTGSSTESSLSLGISQEFLLADKRGKRLAGAERELEIYRWQLAEREQTVRDEVKAAFYTLLLAEQRVALADRSILLNRQLFDVARERLAAGDIPELEANLVRVELARSEGGRIGAEREHIQGQAKLYALMGAPLAESMAFAGDLAALPSMPRSLEELQQLARSNRPDFRRLAAEKARSDAEVALVIAEGIPNLTAGLAFRRDSTGMVIGGLAGRDTTYSVGVKLSIPIPLFDRNQAELQAAQVRRNNSEKRLAVLAVTVERDVASAYSSFLNSEAVLALYRDTILSQLEENLQLTREAYRLGEVGVLAVIQEQKKFFEVNDGYLTALHDRQAALVKLETVTASECTGGEK